MRLKTRVLELYCHPTFTGQEFDWIKIIKEQHSKYYGSKCDKVRKSNPELTIGTCTVRYGSKDYKDLIICPHRFVQDNKIFADCLPLMENHHHSNEIHLLSEIAVPGGSVDYFLVSAKNGTVVDFVGIETQSLDTTGTVWPERQRFVATLGIEVDKKDVESKKVFGVNWKMNAKTILVQIHHKIETFEHMKKHLVLVLQDHLLNYMKSEFSFEKTSAAKMEDPMHFHAYSLKVTERGCELKLADRYSTDSAGISKCLELQADPRMEIKKVFARLQAKISPDTILWSKY